MFHEIQKDIVKSYKPTAKYTLQKYHLEQKFWLKISRIKAFAAMI